MSRPILCVIRLSESGKDVIFKKHGGGIIRDTRTGVTTTFRRKHGIYAMGIWVKTGPEIAGGAARDNPGLRPTNAGNPDVGFARRT